MSNKKEIALSEAQDLYAKNEALREFLESKFSKEELTANTAVEEKFKRVWEEKILTQCDSVKFLDAEGSPTKTPTPRTRVLKKEGEGLFEYDPSGKNKYFWYSYHNVHVLLSQEVSLDDNVLQRFIASWVEDTLGIQGAIPMIEEEEEECERIMRNTTHNSSPCGTLTHDHITANAIPKPKL